MASGLGKRQQVLIMIMLTIGCVYGYLRYVHDPTAARLVATVKKHNALVQEVAGLDGEPVNEAAIRESMRPLEKELAALKEEVDALTASRIAGADSRDQVVYVVNETALTNYVTIKELAPTTPDKLNLPPDEVQEFRRLDRAFYKVRCTGDFIDFYGFVSDLCRVERLVNLTGLSIVRSRDAEGQVEVEFVLVI